MSIKDEGLYPTCIDCGHKLSSTEYYYYDVRCELCETDRAEVIECYRNGKENEELDDLYGVKETKH